MADPNQQTTEDEDDAQAQADFDSGASMDETRPLTADQPEDKPEDKAAPQTTEATPIRAPKYVRVTAEQFERLEAAAKRSDDQDKQMSKAFGTLGDLQKIVKTLQTSTPRGTPVEIPKEAFAAMEKDFPELAAHTRAALEATLKGMTGTGTTSAEVNTDDLDRRVTAGVLKLQTEALEDAHPNWQKIVGAVDVTRGEQPDPNNAFRKWLSTKDAAYQVRLNGTNSADVISRAISAFHKDMTPPAAPAARSTDRADLIRDSVRPRGDGGHAKAPSADDDFEAGFRGG